MTVDIQVRFPSYTYSGRTPAGEPEWPPAPSRLFGAFTAAAGNDTADRDLLRRLEHTVVTSITASSQITPGRPIIPGVSAMKTDETGESIIKKVYSGVSTASGMTTDSGGPMPVIDTPAVLDTGTVTYRIDNDPATRDNALDDTTVASLHDLAGRITHLGTSRDTVIVSVRRGTENTAVATDPDTETTWTIVPHHPAGHRGDHSHSNRRFTSLRTSRSWYPNYLDNLTAVWAVDDRNPDATAPRHRPTPARTEQIDLITSVAVDDAAPVVPLRFTTPVPWGRASRLLAGLAQITDTAARIVTDDWRRNIIGVTVPGGDPDTLPELLAAVNDFRAVEEGDTRWGHHASRTGTTLVATTAVHGPDPTLTWAKVVADVLAATDMTFAEASAAGIEVHLRHNPELPCATASPGMQRYDVAITDLPARHADFCVGHDTDRGAGQLRVAEDTGDTGESD